MLHAATTISIVLFALKLAHAMEPITLYRRAPHGAVEADPSLRPLPLSDPRCNSDACLAFEIAHNHSQATVSYYRQFDYGHWVAWYYSIIIFLLALLHFWRTYRSRNPSARSYGEGKAGPVDKIKALGRWVGYRRLHGTMGNLLALPSVGMLIFFVVGVGVMMSMTFAIRPYYRERRGYGSPPLAIRTGLMAAAFTPLLLVLSGKFNLVTLITGIGYEKLNVVHRWVGWATFGLSVAHTIPFLVAPLREGGRAALKEQFYSPGGFEVSHLLFPRTQALTEVSP